MADEAVRARVPAWDVATRLFHWSLMALIVFAWWSVENHHLDWHKTAGSAVAGLLVFRLWWGFFGGSTARFGDFLRGPKALAAYLFGRGDKGRPSLGHNPLGGLSVIALLLTCIAVVGFGLFAVDTDGLESGPLSFLVDYDQGRLASKLHDYAFQVLEALVVLHLLAIAFYTFVKRQPLVDAMLDGRKPAEDGKTPLKPASFFALLFGLALGAATTYVLIKMGS